MQIWNNLRGDLHVLSTLFADKRYPRRPSRTRRISKLVSPPNGGNRYGVKLTAYYKVRPVIVKYNTCIFECITNVYLTRLILNNVLLMVNSFCELLSFPNPRQQYLHFLLQPPRSGRYTFYLSGDDQCRLSISSDYTSKNLRMIAMFPRGLWTKRNQWNKYVSNIHCSSIVFGMDITCIC
jgi:hypothetical protein